MPRDMVGTSERPWLAKNAAACGGGIQRLVPISERRESGFSALAKHGGCDELKRWRSVPDFKKREFRDTGVFVRTLGKCCPICGDVFFGYQVEGAERKPYQVDPDPTHGDGMRETCGDLSCWEVEDYRQFQHRLKHRKEEEEKLRAKRAAAAALTPQPGPILL